jgi:hypothetical protein
MKLPKLTALTAGIKTFFVLCLIGFFCLFAIAMKVKNTTEDIWKQLGLTQPDAQKNIDNSFIQGRFYYIGAKNARNVVLGDRVAVVNQLVAYAKKYTSSPEFIKAYQEYQNKRSETMRRSLPKKPEQKTVETIKAEELLLLEKRLATAESYLKSENPNVKKSATVQVENIKKEMQALDDPNNAVVKRKLDLANRNYEYQLKVYNQAMQNFEAKYPSDPKPILKQRLQEILTITADVDYSAELKNGDNGKKVFVNPDYEKKPAEWKLAFRTGKTATDAVRVAAQQWLNELNASANAERSPEHQAQTHNVVLAR